MTTVRADRVRNDERILLAAARVLAADPDATVQAVADAAGVARLTVYRRYPDRAALVAALRAAVDIELDSALDDLPSWTYGPRVVAALVHALARVAVRYPIALLRYAAPAAPVPADARIEALLREGQRRGVLRPDLAAASMNSALFGVLSALLAAEHGAGGDPDPDDLATTVLALLLPGLTPATTKGSP